MAKYQLLLPKMGESVAEATIIKWLKQPGDYIEADESVMDIATDKVDSEVPAPVSGTLVEQLYKIDDVVQVGAVIAIIETKEAAEPVATPETADISTPEVIEPVKQEETAPAVTEHEEEEKPVIETTEPIPGTEQLAQNTTPANPVVIGDNVRFYSPLVRSIASQEGIGNTELDSIPGTGAEGRLTKDDLLFYIQNRSAISPVSQPALAAEPAKVQEEAPIITKAEPVIDTPKT